MKSLNEPVMSTLMELKWSDIAFCSSLSFLLDSWDFLFKCLGSQSMSGKNNFLLRASLVGTLANLLGLKLDSIQSKDGHAT